MKAPWVLAVYLTAVFAAPTTSRPSNTGGMWDFQSSVLQDFEENFRKMREEFETLEKSLESRFKIPVPDGTGYDAGFFPNVFNIDPSKVKNESFSDTKVVDGKVIHTEEQVISNKNSVVHFKKVEIKPKDEAAPPTGIDKKNTFNTPESPSPVPELTTSKNELDSVPSDNNGNNPVRSRDVEEIENDIEPQELRAPLEVRNAESDAISEVADNDLYESGSNVYPSTVVDLSSDTKVNDILTENIKSGGLIQPEPDAEIIEINTNNINNKATYDTARNPVYDPRYYYHYAARPLN